jgi:hypothetical protein
MARVELGMDRNHRRIADLIPRMQFAICLLLSTK